MINILKNLTLRNTISFKSNLLYNPSIKYFSTNKEREEKLYLSKDESNFFYKIEKIYL